MKEIVRCKPCGYVGEVNMMGDTCPACGASSKFFEPYKDKMKPNRRKILKLDMHPIAVHFPQTICVFIVQFVLLNIVFPDFKAHIISEFILILSVILPLAVLGAFVSGLIDGKIRFKKLGTRLLVRKIILASAMTLCSVGLAILVIMLDYTFNTKLIILAISAIILLFAILLGRIGKGLMYAEMPG